MPGTGYYLTESSQKHYEVSYSHEVMAPGAIWPPQTEGPPQVVLTGRKN